jgi:DNA-binding transcriptional LysR family regulator
MDLFVFNLVSFALIRCNVAFIPKTVELDGRRMMTRNKIKYMESATALAEELHFSRAASKIGISQPMLTKNIQDLETLVGVPLFVRDRKSVILNDAGRAYVQQARLSLLHGARAVQAARAVVQDADAPLSIGRSPSTDPFLVSTLLSIELPLFPRLKIELSSQYSFDLVHDLLAGALDLVIATEPQESPLLTKVQVADSPFYIAMAKRDELAGYPTVTMEMMAGRRWILFERRLHPPIYDAILNAAEQRSIRPSKIQHMTVPEEAFPFVAGGSAVAFLVKAGALLVARNGVTIRPLAEPALRMKTYLTSRADDESKLLSEFVRAFMRKILDLNKYKQLTLPISG